MGKWKNWTPKPQVFDISQESEPTKPSKLGFVGFVGDVSAQNQKICLPPRKASETELEALPSSMGQSVVTTGGIELPSLPMPGQDQPVANQIFEHAPNAEPTERTKLAMCVHCLGRGLCDCASCTLGRTAEPRPCSMCKIDDHEQFIRETSPNACWHCDGMARCSCIVCQQGPCTVCRKWIQ
jgi:hypothetical protein